MNAMLSRLLSHDLPRSRVLAAILIVIVLGLALAPFVFPGVKALNVAAKVLIFIVLVAAFDLLLGYTGIVSFAHTMFFGIGAYGIAIACSHLGATWGALALGTLAALAVYRSRFFGREAVSFLLLLPIALPGIVTGIALRSAMSLGGIPFSFWTIVVGHATFCVVVVYNNVLARFRRTASSQIEASMDLGATSFQTFRHIVLPNIATALLAGGMLAFALSFDEVIVTTFTAGQQETLPIWILSQLVRPRNRPVTNVVAVFVIAATFIPILIAHRLTRDAGEVAGGGK